MSKPWSIVKLGEVIRHRKEFVRIDDLSKRDEGQVESPGSDLEIDFSGRRSVIHKEVSPVLKHSAKGKAQSVKLKANS